jgi:hypothetical protein
MRQISDHGSIGFVIPHLGPDRKGEFNVITFCAMLADTHAISAIAPRELLFIAKLQQGIKTSVSL